MRLDLHFCPKTDSENLQTRWDICHTVSSVPMLWASLLFVSFQGEPELSEDSFPLESLEGMPEDVFQNETVPIILPTAIKLHSGLWRVCVYYEELGESDLHQTPLRTVEGVRVLWGTRWVRFTSNSTPFFGGCACTMRNWVSQIYIKFHSGLWRVCLYYEELGESDLHQTPLWTVEGVRVLWGTGWVRFTSDSTPDCGGCACTMRNWGSQIYIKLHSGLWTVCVYYEELGESDLHQTPLQTVEGVRVLWGTGWVRFTSDSTPDCGGCACTMRNWVSQIYIRLHSGLWRVCVYYEELGESHLHQTPLRTVEGVHVLWGTGWVRFTSDSTRDCGGCACTMRNWVSQIYIKLHSGLWRVCVYYEELGESDLHQTPLRTVEGVRVLWGTGWVRFTSNSTPDCGQCACTMRNWVSQIYIKLDSGLWRVCVYYEELGESDLHQTPLRTVEGVRVLWGTRWVRFTSDSTPDCGGCACTMRNWVSQIYIRLHSGLWRVCMYYEELGESDLHQTPLWTVEGVRVLWGTGWVRFTLNSTRDCGQCACTMRNWVSQIYIKLHSGLWTVCVYYEELGESDLHQTPLRTVEGVRVLWGTGWVRFTSDSTPDCGGCACTMRNWVSQIYIRLHSGLWRVCVYYEELGESDLHQTPLGTVEGLRVLWGTGWVRFTSNSTPDSGGCACTMRNWVSQIYIKLHSGLWRVCMYYEQLGESDLHQTPLRTVEGVRVLWGTGWVRFTSNSTPDCGGCACTMRSWVSQIYIKLHSRLWRVCVYYEELGESDLHQTPLRTVEGVRVLWGTGWVRFRSNSTPDCGGCACTMRNWVSQIYIKLHSGLWRVCVYYEQLGESDLYQTLTPDCGGCACTMRNWGSQIYIKLYSGLWRVCVYYEELGESDLHQTSLRTVEVVRVLWGTRWVRFTLNSTLDCGGCACTMKNWVSQIYWDTIAMY